MRLTNRPFQSVALWIIIAVAQVTVMSSLSINHSVVNLVVANILLWDYFGADRRQIWLGVVLAGLTLDIFSPLFFGAVTILLCFIAALSHYVHRRLANYLTYALLLGGCFLAVILYDLGGLAIAGLATRVGWWTIALDGILTTIFASIELVAVFFVAKIIWRDSNLLNVRVP